MSGYLNLIKIDSLSVIIYQKQAQDQANMQPKIDLQNLNTGTCDQQLNDTDRETDMRINGTSDKRGIPFVEW